MAQAIINVLVFLNSLYLLQVPSVTNECSWWKDLYAKSPGFVVTISNCLAVSFAFVQNYMTFFVSLYRMTIIVFPASYNKLWKYALPLAVLTALTTPFISTYPMLIIGSEFILLPQSNSYCPVLKGSLTTIISQLQIFMTVFMIISSLVNIISVVMLCIRAKRYRGEKAERNMFILALLDFAIQAAFYVLFVIIFDDLHDLDLKSGLVIYASDVLTLSNAYLLIILNKRIRQRVIRMLKCKVKCKSCKAPEVHPINVVITRM